jgi:hypothetical protein
MEIKKMSNERFEYLISNTPDCIYGCFITKDKKVDINNFLLSINNGNEHKRINHLTKGSYFSKKPLFVFDIKRVELLPHGKKIIVLTNAESKYINDNFCDLNGKIFKTEHQLQMENTIRNYKEQKLNGTVGWFFED